MSWRQQKSNKRSGVWHDSFGSSGEDRFYPYTTRRPAQCPAASAAEEAIWRAAKRVGSAWRWLKLDLGLLAKGIEYEQVMVSLELTLKQFGQVLLPEFGRSPIGTAVLAQRSLTLLAFRILFARLASSQICQRKAPRRSRHNCLSLARRIRLRRHEAGI